MNRSKTIHLHDLYKNQRLPSNEALLLLSCLTEKSKEYLLTHGDRAVSLKTARAYKRLASRRLSSWPIAYLTGHKEFYGLNFWVSTAVLVPRPETEMIVDLVLNQFADGLRLIDIGTGSGAIPIAIAASLRRRFPATYRRASISAIDISPAALKVARRNAKKHRLDKKIKFYQGNLIAPLSKSLGENKLPLVITANLPYLTPKQIKDSPSIQREPRLALDGGKDGLRLYRQLFCQIKKIEIVAGTTVICEIDPSQARSIALEAKRHFPASRVEIIPDLARQKRLAVIRL